MSQQINTRDVHIAVTLDDGTTELVRRRNPHQVAWELYAARKGYPIGSPILSITYQAWHGLRTTVKLPDFDTWADTVDEVYLATSDGVRLIVEHGKLVAPDGERLDDTPDPTQQVPESGA